ncbi:serine hydrolase domain-containing protein [Maribacter halichondriae]|uniref:serine hydrolase domain-containing protein n=1 Tax=Maribacter halichondriae TaxID=2980554 RepID=UPI0023592186|nr:serine hydrolase [Maribacter sp. Hal144]
MKRFKRILLIGLPLVAVAIFYNYPKLNIISGYASKNMASTVFIADRGSASITENDNNIPLIKLADVEMHGTEASASVFGLMERKTVCREGLGCVLVNEEGDLNSTLKPKRNKVDSLARYPFGLAENDTVSFEEVDYEQLEKAIDNAFANPEVQKTRTVLIAYKNQIVGERYLDGFSKDTPILGWSMTKSILATLYGILKHQQKIDLENSAPLDSWQGDERRNITLNHLLRMQSGLAWKEDYTAISDVTRMLFLDADMSMAQEEREAMTSPTEIWNYSSGTTNLLSGILRKQFKTHQEYLDFPYASLIDKIGMHSMLIETDMAGNYVGSSYGWASTRDWAKFGILHLNKGNWNGEQLFAPEWIEYITTPTEHSEGTYGAHWWLNAQGKYPGVPKDLYSANGYQGQYVFIIPSKDLVIVRTGLAEDPDFDAAQFLREIVTAVR